MSHLSTFMYGKKYFLRRISFHVFIIEDAYKRELGRIVFEHSFNPFRIHKILLSWNDFSGWSVCIGRGKEGIAYPIFADGDRVQGALVEKPCIVRDNLDVYNLYAVEPELLELSALLALCVDARQYRNLHGMAKKKISYTYTTTLNPAIRALYCKEFKEMC